MQNSSSCSEWNVDKTWSSQEWKSDELVEDRTWRPVLFAQHTDRFVVENDNMDSYTGAESEMSLNIQIILEQVNDRVRKRQYQSSQDATKDNDKHSVIWRSLCLLHCKHLYSWGKNAQTILHSIKKTEDLTMKQMFDISEKLISEQSDETYGVNTNKWEDSWKHLSLVGSEKVISLSHTKVYIFFRFCVMRWKDERVWEDKLTWFKGSSQCRASDTFDGEPTEFEWNISQHSPHCSSATKSKSSRQK